MRIMQLSIYHGGQVGIGHSDPYARARGERKKKKKLLTIGVDLIQPLLVAAALLPHTLPLSLPLPLLEL